MNSLPIPSRSSSDLSPLFGASRPTPRGALARQHRRDLEQLSVATELRIAAVDAAADVQAAKLDAIASTGNGAMQRAALVNMAQQQLAMACPAAAGDLDFIKTITVMQLGQVVADTQQTLRRL